MPFDAEVGLLILIFSVAVLYSSVGHGGASGYLAVLALFAIYSPAQMSSTALMLNVIVAGIAFTAFWREGHFSRSLTWPFLVTSIPAALVGGMLNVTGEVYNILLAFTLIIAAVRLALWISQPSEKTITVSPGIPVSLSVGAGIGLLSGIVGVGGGIFLSPVILIMKWADARTTSATAAFIIVANSLSGLAGRLLHSGIQVGDMGPLLIVACVGGLIGSHFGARKFSGIALRRILGAVLFVAAGKLLFAV